MSTKKFLLHTESDTESEESNNSETQYDKEFDPRNSDYDFYRNDVFFNIHYTTRKHAIKTIKKFLTDTQNEKYEKLLEYFYESRPNYDLNKNNFRKQLKELRNLLKHNKNLHEDKTVSLFLNYYFDDTEQEDTAPCIMCFKNDDNTDDNCPQEMSEHEGLIYPNAQFLKNNLVNSDMYTICKECSKTMNLKKCPKCNQRYPKKFITSECKICTLTTKTDIIKMELDMVVHKCKEEDPFIDYLHERGFKVIRVNAKSLYYRLTFELFKAACDFKKIRRPEVFKKQLNMSYDEIYDPHDKVYGFSFIESDPLFGDIYLKQKETKPEVYDQLTKYIQQYSDLCRN